MNSYSLTHLSDQTLLRDLVAAVSRERTATTVVLAHIAEVDARRLYAPAGYPSMFSYCVGELHLSEDAAFKRIRAARTAREFPAIFAALADGRLHLAAVVLLTPYLSAGSADELIVAATHRSKTEIEQLLAKRFPQPDVLTLVTAIPQPSGASSAEPLTPERAEPATTQVAAERENRQLAPGPVETVVDVARLKPLAPQRFALQFTIGQSAHDKLRYAQELLSHQLPFGDIAEIFERALDLLIPALERRKFAATDKPRNGANCSRSGSRHIPAQVRRAVWQRDGGQCTYVSASGKRCPARRLLEFDHADPVARGGRASVSGIRLRCRAHNQLEAERAFGAGFMENKRRAAEALAEARAKAEAAARAKAAAAEVIPWLRKLGLRAEEVRQGAAFCETIPDAPLDERVRAALSHFSPRTPLGHAIRGTGTTQRMTSLPPAAGTRPRSERSPRQRNAGPGLAASRKPQAPADPPDDAPLSAPALGNSLGPREVPMPAGGRPAAFAAASREGAALSFDQAVAADRLGRSDAPLPSGAA